MVRQGEQQGKPSVSPGTGRSYASVQVVWVAVAVAAASWSGIARGQPVARATPAAQPKHSGGQADAGSGDDFQLGGDAPAGKTVFTSNCAVCHGMHGKGDGPAAAGIKPAPPDFTDKKWAQGITDKQIYEVIRGGGAAVGRSAHMPAWKGRLSDSQIRDVAAYIRSLTQ